MEAEIVGTAQIALKVQPKRLSIMAALAVAFIFQPCSVSAFQEFGFASGMSRNAVEQASLQRNLGAAKWFGRSLVVQAPDHPSHSYLFQFCEDKLYEISQQFPANFEQMAGFVDATIRQFGPPNFVSAFGGMADGGFVRPINLYWKIGEKDHLRLMQLRTNYSIIYSAENSCEKVPN